MSYNSGQVAGSTYSQLSRSPSKRQRSEDTPYAGYMPPRSMTDSGFGMPDTTYSPAANARMQPHAARARWSMFGAPPVSSPQTPSEMYSRSSSLPRLDPNLAGGQPPNTGVMPQGAVPPGSGAQAMNPAAAPFQPQHFQYGSVAGPGGYPSFQHNQQYPTDTRYAPQPGMYASDPGALPQQYADPSQGYQGGYDNSAGNRSSYHIPSTRGW